ncbi:hypothetical protein SLA2020_030650 [Shorea laevis]
MSQSERTSVSLTISDDTTPQSESQSLDPAHLPSDLEHPPSNSETASTLHQQLQNLELKVEEPEKKDDIEEDGRSDDDVEKDDENGDGDENRSEQLEENSDGRRYNYPVRPEAEDCAYYMKTGLCKFGSNCKFNHPIRKKNQVVKEKIKDKDESIDKSSQTECKYYMRTGGCKYGKACRFNHSRAKASAAPVLELNFLGLPIRLGEKECPYYMRNGSCKYGANCKFNHPDPTAAGACDSPGYGNGGSVTSQVASQVGVASWLSPGTMNEAATYMPIMFPPPPQGVPSQNPGWNGFQAAVDSPERSLCSSSGFVMNSPSTETSVYTHHQPPMLVDEFPERPGQPDCSYFMKTGDCKFKSNCKFHHPKDRIAKAPPCSLSDKGLPLRPDQNTCGYYSRYGICKFGPACKFDHPSDLVSTVSVLDQSPSLRSSSIEEAGMAGSNAVDATVQQQV